MWSGGNVPCQTIGNETKTIGVVLNRTGPVSATHRQCSNCSRLDITTCHSQLPI